MGTNGPITLVLDIDETLIHTYSSKGESGVGFVNSYGVYRKNKKLFFPPDQDALCYSMDSFTGSDEIMWGMFRPHLREFMIGILSIFDNIVIWSAGMEPYVKNMTQIIFKHVGTPPPKLIQSRPHCRETQGTFHKPIADLKKFTCLRNLNLDIDTRRTFILDDKKFTFMNNEENGILIPQYKPGNDRTNRVPTLEDLLDRSDDNLMKILKWFRGASLKDVPDFTVLDTGEIFK
jgi:TFIIF-interacting CTD phosphatase-like protein